MGYGYGISRKYVDTKVAEGGGGTSNIVQAVTDGFEGIIFKREHNYEIDPVYIGSDTVNEFLKIDTRSATKIKLHLPYSEGDVEIFSKEDIWGILDFVGWKGGESANTIEVTVGDFSFGEAFYKGRIVLWEDGDTDIITGVIDSTHISTVRQSYKDSQSFTIKTANLAIESYNGFGQAKVVGMGTAYSWATRLHIASQSNSPGLLVGCVAGAGSSGTMCIAGSCGNLGWIQLPCHYDEGSQEWEDASRGGLIISLNAKHGAAGGGWDLQNDKINYPHNNAINAVALVLSYHYNNYYVDNREYRGLCLFGNVTGDKSLREVFQVTTWGRIGISHPQPTCRLQIEDWNGWSGGFSDGIFSTHLNDFDISGIWTLSTPKDYIFKISSIGVIDKFQWSEDGGANWSAEIDIPALAAFMPLENGIKIRWRSQTGHTLDDYWSYHIFENYGQFVIKEGKVGIGTLTTPDSWLQIRTEYPRINLERIDQIGWRIGVDRADRSDLGFWNSSESDPEMNITSEGHLEIKGELKIKVYSQESEPSLAADSRMAIWIDTNDSNRTYLVFRRGTGDQIKIELT